MHLAGFLHCDETNWNWRPATEVNQAGSPASAYLACKCIIPTSKDCWNLVSPNMTRMYDIHNKCYVHIKYFVTSYQVSKVLCESIFFHKEIQQNVALAHEEVNNSFLFPVQLFDGDMETRKKNDRWLMENMYLRSSRT